MKHKHNVFTFMIDVIREMIKISPLNTLIILQTNIYY